MDIQFKCSRCGSDYYFTKKTGPHVGIYCVKCGAWNKWANKEEVNLISEDSDLKPCPFCGNKDVKGVYIAYEKKAAVYCPKCLAYGPKVKGTEDVKRDELWNHRATNAL